MAPVLSEWVPEGDLAHFVSDLVEGALDLSQVYASYEDERGFPPYDPRLMLHQCFNGQAVVDEEAQVILAADASAQAPDAPQLEPALAQLEENLAAIDAELPAGPALTADAGYFSQDNVKAAEDHGLDPYIATGRQKHSDPPAIAPRGRIPKDATPKQRMARKNKTKQGQATYARRKAIVEPVFGQLQTVQGARQLLIRGLDAARAQWRFNCAVHNPAETPSGGRARAGRGRIAGRAVPRNRPPATKRLPAAANPRQMRRSRLIERAALSHRPRISTPTG